MDWWHVLTGAWQAWLCQLNSSQTSANLRYGTGQYLYQPADRTQRVLSLLYSGEEFFQFTSLLLTGFQAASEKKWKEQRCFPNLRPGRRVGLGTNFSAHRLNACLLLVTNRTIKPRKRKWQWHDMLSTRSLEGMKTRNQMKKSFSILLPHFGNLCGKQRCTKPSEMLRI